MNELAMITSNPKAIHTVFNTAVGDRTNLKELVEYLRSLLAEYDPNISQVAIKYGPARAGDIPHSLANIDKARALLGYVPSHKIKEGLKDAIVWYWNNLKHQ
jgi:UDP-N-acetylglucosamine 4-epimerase